MTELTATFSTAPTEPETETERRPPRRGLWLVIGFVALVASAWGVSRLGLFKASDDVSYWIGVAGGSMMATLLLYPLRKRWAWMQRLGRLKWWFVVHMALGLLGPWLILVHSTFHVGSLNAAVALYSMCVVVLSGVVGRFIYVRVHRGLRGEQTSLEALKTSAGMVESEARSWLRFAPEVEARLIAFEEREHAARPGWLTWVRQTTWLPLVQWWTYRRCAYELQRKLRKMARRSGWDREQFLRRERRSRKLVARYLTAVVRVAQYTAYERIFALWHVAHIPVLVLLVVSAIVHVIAVHAY
jgi:hypothetical protein